MKVKLGDICSFQSGGTPSKTNADYFSGDIPWITTVALNGQTIGKTAAIEWITEKAIKESATKIVPAKSIMVGTRVGVGKVAINEAPMSTSQDIISLVGINESLWSKEFLCKFIQSKEAYLKSQARGATIKGIKIDVLASLDIPDIPLASQQEIVAILDKAQLILAARRSQISALDDLIKARFVEMFGDPVLDTKKWGQKPLMEMLESIRYGTSTPPTFAGEGYAFIRATNIKNGRIIDDDMKFIPQNEAAKLGKCKLLGGELLIVRSGVNAGDTCVITEKYKGQYAGYDMILNLKDVLNPYFLNVLINTEYMDRVVKPLTRRAAQPHLNSEQVQSFPVICVPIDKQEEFADFMVHVDKSKYAIQKALDETQLLFDSLMQKYFG